MTQDENRPENDGILILKVKTGLGIFPVPDAMVTVTSEQRENSDVMFIGMTDDAGITAPVLLPAGIPQDERPNAAGKLTPDTYTVEVSKDGYFTLIRYGVPVYPGVTAVQTLYLTPKPAGVPTEEEIQYTGQIQEDTLNESEY